MNFWQVLLDGGRYATFGYWGLPVLLAAGVWIARTTSDALFRGLMLGLPLLGIVSLLSTASIQVVPRQHLDLPLVASLVIPLVGFVAHLVSLVPGDEPRLPRLFWAATNLTFIGRATLYLGAYV